MQRYYLWPTILLGGGFYLYLGWEITRELPGLADKLLERVSDGIDGDTTDLRNLTYAIGAILGALALLATVPFQLIKTWMNERAAQTAESGQITDRINKAVEQLGAEKATKKNIGDATIEQTEPNLEVRLGGIYALERIAQDSLRDHIQVMEILCAYIRNNAPASAAEDHGLGDWTDWPEEADAETLEQRKKALWKRRDDLRAWAYALPLPRIDIQAALSVIGRRKPRQIERERAETYRLDLRATNLRRADLKDLTFDQALFSGARMEGAVLTRAWMEGANLIKARMEGAGLSRARMEGANLIEAQMEGANLIEARMEGAGLIEARMEGAVLFDARMVGADLRWARMEGADLRGARMEGANLIEAQMEGADLRGAQLKSAKLSGWTCARAQLGPADFTGCSAMTAAQVNSAFGIKAGPGRTLLPDHLSAPAFWFDAEGMDVLEVWGPFDEAFREWLKTQPPAKSKG